MKQIVLILTLVSSLLCLPGPAKAATQVDALINKLVEKGILNKKEALDLKAEIVNEEKVAREENFKQGLPEWVQNTKLKGDFRLRYQYERKASDTDSRDRGRVRYRLGLETKLTDQVKVGAGLASGADDPRSTNQTFQDTFERGDVRLDYAYGEYTPNKKLALIGGVFPKTNYLWAPTDLLWDTDINPTGGAVHFENPLIGNATGYLNSGVLAIDESTSSDLTDPFMTFVQGGLKWKDKLEGEKFDANIAGTYYAFNGVKGANLDWCSGTNTGRTAGANTTTGVCSGAPKFDFDSAGVSAELGANQLFNGLPLNIDDRIAVFGDFIHNVDPSALNNGWATGVKFGHKKVANKNQWQMKYQYSYLGKDAWYDAFPDSDRYAGQTDTRGHEAILEYGLHKNVILSLDYYQDQKIKAAKNKQHLLQADLNFKF